VFLAGGGDIFQSWESCFLCTIQPGDVQVSVARNIPPSVRDDPRLAWFSRYAGTSAMNGILFGVENDQLF